VEKSERVAIAKHVLSLIENETPYMGDESWEADIGRFIDQERFDLEKQKLFLERPQLIALSADVPNPGDYYATDIAGKPMVAGLIIKPELSKQVDANSFFAAK